MKRNSSEKSQPAGKAWSGTLYRTLISILLIGGGVACFLGLGRGRTPELKGNQKAMRPAVEVVPVTLHDSGIDFKVDGVVIPFRTIEVPAEVRGRVQFKSENCRLGHTVSQGELLMRIDPEDYELEVRRLQEDVKQATTNLHELEVETNARTRQIELAREDLAIKQREVKRYENIEDPGVYSKSELDSARLKELQARCCANRGGPVRSIESASQSSGQRHRFGHCQTG